MFARTQFSQIGIFAIQFGTRSIGCAMKRQLARGSRMVDSGSQAAE
jgi:hypothetical protein